MFNVECLQKISSNGQIWPPKKHLLQDFTGLEIKISVKASKTENQLSTRDANRKLESQFSVLKTGFQINFFKSIFLSKIA